MTATIWHVPATTGLNSCARSLETAVEGLASNRYHPQPGMQCSWCQYKNECLRWLPGQALPERMVV